MPFLHPRNAIAFFAVLSLLLFSKASNVLGAGRDERTLSKQPLRQTVRGMDGDSAMGIGFVSPPKGIKTSRNSNSNNSNRSSNINNTYHNRRVRKSQRRNQQQRRLPLAGWVYRAIGENWIFIKDDGKGKASKFPKKEKSKKFFQNAKKSFKSETSKGTEDAAAPSRSPMVSEPTQAPFTSGLIDGSDIGSSSNGSNGSDSQVICQPVASLESPPSESASREFSMTVDVEYQQSDTTSSAEIESYLNDQNLPMALWLAGCQDEATPVDGMETAGFKRRKLQEETAPAPLITYSQVDDWESTGACAEEDGGETGGSSDPFITGLLESVSPPCQEGFSSTISLQARENASSEELATQISQSFYATSKPYLESQQGVVSVSIREIREIGGDSRVDGLQVEQNQSQVDRENRRTIIIACSIVGACIFVCVVLLILICTYEKRRKALYTKSRYVKDGEKVLHVPFEDELESDSSDSEDSMAGDLILVTTDKIRDNSPSDESATDSEQFDDDEDEDLPPPPPAPEAGSPCYNGPSPPAPFDEFDRECSAATCQKCEQQRQMGVGRSREALIKSIDSSAPVTIVPMDVSPSTVTSPRIERRKLNLDVNSSRRSYDVEDVIEL